MTREEMWQRLEEATDPRTRLFWARQLVIEDHLGPDGEFEAPPWFWKSE